MPQLHIVLGSGLSSAFNKIELSRAWELAGTLKFADIPGLQASTAPGHSGIFRYYLHRKTVQSLCFQVGRLHGYEGLTAREVVQPLVASFEAGTRNFVLTNAAASLKKKLSVGSVMILEDQVNLTGTSPLVGPNLVDSQGRPLGPRFPDMSAIYDRKMSKDLSAVLKKQKFTVHKGVYLGVLGPAYESPAEIELFSQWGLSAVGMSTVWESQILRYMGARLCGLSFISNLGCGLSDKPIRHEDVEEIGRQLAKELVEALFIFAEKELKR